MRTFLDHSQQGGKYSAQIASHEGELRKKENFVCQESVSLSSL